MKPLTRENSLSVLSSELKKPVIPPLDLKLDQKADKLPDYIKWNDLKNTSQRERAPAAAGNETKLIEACVQTSAKQQALPEAPPKPRPAGDDDKEIERLNEQYMVWLNQKYDKELE